MNYNRTNKQIKLWTTLVFTAGATIPLLLTTQSFSTNAFIATNQALKHADATSSQVNPKATINQEKIVKDVYGVKISERSVLKDHPLKETEFFLGEQGLDLLITKIKTRLGIGPEFFTINEIVITQGFDGGLISERTNGLYYMEMQQIILNTDHLIGQFRPVWENRHEYLDDITEMLFHTLYHEFGHHVFNTYFLPYDRDSAIPKDAYLTNWILRNGEYQEEFFHKNFIQDFKQNLSYDRHTKYTTNEYVRNAKNQVITLQTGQKLKSLGAIYNAKELFDQANNKYGYDYSRIRNDSMTYYAWTAAPQTKQTKFYGSDPNYLNYIYGLQELLTRKYMQLTFPFKTTKLIDSEGYFTPPHQNKVPTTYLRDTLTYQEGFGKGKKFLSDSIFDVQHRADKLIDSFHKYTGQLGAKNISIIWHQNDVRLDITNGITKKVNNQEQDVTSQDVKTKNIRFGGFLDESLAQAKYIGYFDKYGFNPIPIQVYDHEYNRLPHLAAKKRNPITRGAEKFYVTTPLENNGWIDLAKIQQKQLFFAQDSLGKEVQPLTSVLGDDTLNNRVLATTKRFYNFYERLGQTIYAQAIKNEREVSINAFLYQRKI